MKKCQDVNEICPNDTTNESQGKEALKPCRYCNHSGTGLKPACQDMYDGTLKYYIWCMVCDCHGPSVILPENMPRTAGKNRASNLWNTRAGGDA